MILSILLLSCGGDISGSSTKGIPDSSNSTSYSEVDDNNYGSWEEEDVDSFSILEEISDTSNKAKIEKLKSSLMSSIEGNDVLTFSQLIASSESVIDEEFMDYNGSKGVNNLLHVICNTEGIDGGNFLKVVLSNNRSKFIDMVHKYSSEGLFPADLAVKVGNSSALKVFVEEKLIYVDEGLSMDFFKSNIKLLVDNGKGDIFDLVNEVYKRSNEDNPFIEWELFRKKDKYKKDPIYYAVLNGDVRMVEYLISRRVSLFENYGSSVYGFRKFILDVLEKSSASKEAKSKIKAMIKEAKKKKWHKQSVFYTVSEE